MSNIISLTNGVHLHGGNEPNPDVIESLEELLGLAKDGMVVGFVAMAQRSDGMWRSYEEGPFDIEPTVGHMHRQIHRLTVLAEAQDEDRRDE